MSLATGVCGDAWSQSHRSRSFMETIIWSTYHGNIISTVAMVTLTNYSIVQNSG